MKKIRDLCVPTGKYHDRFGNEKQRWANVGVLLADESTGKMSIKLEMVPTSGWDGWINCFEPKPREGEKPATRAEKMAQVPGNEQISDDIPF